MWLQPDVAIAVAELRPLFEAVRRSLPQTLTQTPQPGVVARRYHHWRPHLPRLSLLPRPAVSGGGAGLGGESAGGSSPVLMKGSGGSIDWKRTERAVSLSVGASSDGLEVEIARRSTRRQAVAA